MAAWGRLGNAACPSERAQQRASERRPQLNPRRHTSACSSRPQDTQALAEFACRENIACLAGWTDSEDDAAAVAAAPAAAAAAGGGSAALPNKQEE